MKTLNWGLIFTLSLFGLVMAVATVFWLPTMAEPFFWLAIFAFCAYIIARSCRNRYFLHGFLVSLCNCVWITALHVLFFNTYMRHHPEMAQMNAGSSLSATHPRLMMAFMGPVFGIASGLVLGLFSFIASKFVRKHF